MLALDLTLVALFTVAWPLYGYFVTFPRLLRDADAGVPGARMKAYLQTIIEEWTLAPIAVGLWVLGGRAPAAMGLGFVHPWRFAIGLALAIGLIALFVLQGKAILARPQVLARAGKSLGPGGRLVPHSATERRTWTWVSVTAGICEEILFRGYLTGVLAAWMGPWWAVAIATLVFGAGHLYLGRLGGIRATIAGAILAGLYALTGSLWVPMLLHAALDLNSGAIGYAYVNAKAAPTESQALSAIA